MARLFDQDHDENDKNDRSRIVPGEWDEDIPWPDPIPEPAFEPAHPAHIPAGFPGPFRRIFRRADP